MKHRQQGVTLIELLIVIVIIGILAGIAVPGYRAYVIRTQRAEAKTELLRLASGLERCFTRFNAYDDAGCAVVAGMPQPSESGNYLLQFNALTPGGYTLAAVPQNGQVADTDCMTLTVTSNNTRDRIGGTKTGQECWAR
jgi:type IV pilus assembly protein PilE